MANREELPDAPPTSVAFHNANWLQDDLNGKATVKWEETLNKALVRLVRDGDMIYLGDGDLQITKQGFDKQQAEAEVTP